MTRTVVQGRGRKFILGAAAAAFSVVSSLGSASIALAQYQEKGALELTGFGGAYFGGTVYAGSSGTLSRDVEVKDDWSYGGKLAYVLSHSIGFEFGYGRSESDMHLGRGAGLPETNIGQLIEDRYELNLNFYTNPGQAQGYFTLGGGATHFGAKFNDGTTAKNNGDSRFTSNFGLGMLFHTSEKLALRLDGRWRWTDTNVGGQDVYCDYYGFCYAYDNSYYSSGELTAGLTYRMR
jgi:hypothetical protein